MAPDLNAKVARPDMHCRHSLRLETKNRSANKECIFELCSRIGHEVGALTIIVSNFICFDRCRLITPKTTPLPSVSSTTSSQTSVVIFTNAKSTSANEWYVAKRKSERCGISILVPNRWI